MIRGGQTDFSNQKPVLNEKRTLLWIGVHKIEINAIELQTTATAGRGLATRLVIAFCYRVRIKYITSNGHK